MLNSEILEAAIGLVFIYLIASLAATSIREAIEGLLKTRAVQLERGIRQLLDDPSGTVFTKQLFDHPLLYSLFAGEYDPATQLTPFFINAKRGAKPGEPAPRRAKYFGNLPAYIPSRNFALALMHLVSGTAENGGALNIGALKANTAALPDSKLKDALQVALGEAQDDLTRTRASLEAWFDGTMDRVSGWYKRETQYILFGLGLLMAVTLNIDTIRISRTLLTNNAIREQLIAEVENTRKSLVPDSGSADQQVTRAIGGLSNLIGHRTLWNEVTAEENRPGTSCVHGEFCLRAWGWIVLLSIPGWIMSGLAISLGAPFWFDTLNKLMVIRSTVKPYEKSAPESSADRGENPPAADALSPAPAGGPESTPAAGGGTGAIAAMGVAAIPVARLRLAFDGADPQTLSFSRNGIPVPVPDEEHLELPLEVDTDHRLIATGAQNGRPVRWEQIVRPTLDDEAEPIAAMLA